MGILEEFFGRETTRKKRRRKSPKARGREAYRKGIKYERDVKKFLRKKGYKPALERYRPTGAEVDLVMLKERKLVVIEAKGRKHPIRPSDVNKLKKKMDRSHGVFKKGIIVSKKGATEKAKESARKSRIQVIKYAGARKKRKSSWW